MTEKDVIKLIKEDESINIEFKESRISPTKDIYQTIWAFLNHVVAENARRIYGFGHNTLHKFTPFHKNPKIARVFREIGRADELGSGVRNIFKYTPIYSKGGNPELLEKDIFKIVIPLIHEIGQIDSEKTTQKILDLIKENPNITRKELAQKIENITEDGIKYHLAKLKQQGKIRRVGPDKGGYWEVVKDEI